MAILVKAPELPFTGGIVTWWEKETGEEVQFGDVLVEIRSGSADYPIKAYLPGTLLHIFAKAGTEVQPDAPLALVGEKNEDIAEWLSLVPPLPGNQPAAGSSLHSSFSVADSRNPVPPSSHSGFTVAASEQPGAFTPPKDTVSPGLDPFSDTGSSFTVSDRPTTTPLPPPTDNLTNEQAQNLIHYGRGFEKFVKMRPVPQQGAMGELFFATQAISGRDVVIKRLKPERRNDAKSREYFMREINLGTALPYHKNSINILYSDENEHGPYYVMERINGHSLQHLIDNRQIPASRLRDIFLGILEGLRHIHAHWMVHRDLKPMNILVDTQLWTPKIIDFGFAKHPSYPDIAVFDMGTAGYMAPEQQGNQQEVTAQADLYAIGCVLYTLVTTEHPHHIDIAKVTDPLYAAIIKRCTEPSPADRYGSVQEIVEVLHQKSNAASEFSTRKETTASQVPLDNFKLFINEWALEALPTDQPLSKLTLKLLQKQAENAGMDTGKLEVELNDFIDLYREVKASSEISAFKKRSLQVQGSLVHISEETIDKILGQNSTATTRQTPALPLVISPSEQKSVSEPVGTPVSEPIPMISVADPVMPSATQPVAQEPSAVQSAFGTLTNRLFYAKSAGLFEAFETEKLTTTQQPDSLYKIHLSNPAQATFVIAANPTAQDTALQNKRFYLHPACVLVEVEPVLKQKITTLEPGKLERSGNFWQIVQKAKIRIG